MGQPPDTGRLMEWSMGNYVCCMHPGAAYLSQHQLTAAPPQTRVPGSALCWLPAPKTPALYRVVKTYGMGLSDFCTALLFQYTYTPQSGRFFFFFLFLSCCLKARGGSLGKSKCAGGHFPISEWSLWKLINVFIALWKSSKTLCKGS